jgi:hypothetical protein
MTNPPLEFEGFAPATPSAEEGGGEALDGAIANTAREDISSAGLKQLREDFDLYCARTDATLAELLARVIEISGDLAEMRRLGSRAAGSSSSKLPHGWVTLKQAAFATEYHRERIRQWAVANLIQAKRVGGRWRVKLESVIAYANKASSP